MTEVYVEQTLALPGFSNSRFCNCTFPLKLYKKKIKLWILHVIQARYFFFLNIVDRILLYWFYISNQIKVFFMLFRTFFLLYFTPDLVCNLGPPKGCPKFARFQAIWAKNCKWSEAGTLRFSRPPPSQIGSILYHLKDHCVVFWSPS